VVELELGGTTTVVLAGGGGLLLLMQPTSNEAAIAKLAMSFTYDLLLGLQNWIIQQGRLSEHRPIP
jgi:hypothetical protein